RAGTVRAAPVGSAAGAGYAGTGAGPAEAGARNGAHAQQIARGALRRDLMIDVRLAVALALAALTLPGCISDGHLNFLGYSTKPLYNCNIKTVYVPIFKNTTSRDTVRQGIEFNLTRRVIEEIETKSHYKVVSDPSCADTELLGTIVLVNKGLLNINQNNEIRMGETIMNVEILWRDRRTGEILSSPVKKQPDALPFATPSIPAPNAYPGMPP